MKMRCFGPEAGAAAGVAGGEDSTSFMEADCRFGCGSGGGFGWGVLRAVRRRRVRFGSFTRFFMRLTAILLPECFRPQGDFEGLLRCGGRRQMMTTGQGGARSRHVRNR